MRKSIITISQQLGCEGSLIGRSLAERLGIPFYDEENLPIDPNNGAASFISMMELEKRCEHAFFSCCYAPFFAPLSLDDIGYLEQLRIVQTIVARGPCVLSGRYSACMLAAWPGALNVLLHSDAEARRNRLRAQRFKGNSCKELDKMISVSDRRQEKIFRIYGAQDFFYAKSYDLCINRDLLDADLAVELIAAVYNADGGKV